MAPLATAHANSSATPEAFFDRWADLATWPEWNTDTEWVRADGPFAEGVTGRMKPKVGPVVRFTVTRWVPGERFVDVARLLGARLTFDHTTQVVDARTTVDVTVSLTGPLAPMWRRILGQGIVASLQGDLDRLVRAVSGPA